MQLLLIFYLSLFPDRDHRAVEEGCRPGRYTWLLRGGGNLGFTSLPPPHLLPPLCPFVYWGALFFSVPLGMKKGIIETEIPSMWLKGAMPGFFLET